MQRSTHFNEFTSFPQRQVQHQIPRTLIDFRYYKRYESTKPIVYLVDSLICCKSLTQLPISTLYLISNNTADFSKAGFWMIGCNRPAHITGVQNVACHQFLASGLLYEQRKLSTLYYLKQNRIELLLNHTLQINILFLKHELSLLCCKQIFQVLGNMVPTDRYDIRLVHYKICHIGIITHIKNH
jgi:hypothetical protein